MASVQDSRAVRVRFGAGAVEALRAELEILGWRHAFIVATPGRGALTAKVRALLGELAAAVFDGAAPHTPATATAAALERLPAGADCLVSLGGGSAIGLAKAVALETGLPIAAVPTTYAGSEMTAIWGASEGGIKHTGRDARVAPRLVIYDPTLTLDLPASVSAASGMNAMAHAVEALYAPNGTPYAAALAEGAIALLASTLPRIVADPRDLAARGDALAGAWLAGSALDHAAMGLHHRLCHVLGGMFGTPHALTHAVLLPHVVDFLAPAAPEAMTRMARALGVPHAPRGLHALVLSLGITTTLADLGLTEDDLERAAGEAAAGAAAHPRPASAGDVRAILRAAWRAA